MRKFTVIGIRIEGGVPQLAGECVTIEATSQEDAISIFLSEREPTIPEELEWDVSAQEEQATLIVER